MLTSIDESGNTGPTDRGGAPYFRLAAVWVPTLDDAEMFRTNIRQLRQKLGLRPNYEFKFAKTHQHPHLRAEFFTTALAQQFRFAVASIDKTDEYWKFADRHEQLWACVTELAALLRPVYCRAEEERATPHKESIVVDDNSDRAFLAIVKRQFRELQSQRRPGSPLVGKVSFRDSAADEMLQLVDMVCGATGTFLDGFDRTWYDPIAERDVEQRLA